MVHDLLSKFIERLSGKTFETSESRGVCAMIWQLQGTRGQKRMMILPAFQPETMVDDCTAPSAVITFRGEKKNSCPFTKPFIGVRSKSTPGMSPILVMRLSPSWLVNGSVVVIVPIEGAICSWQ